MASLFLLLCTALLAAIFLLRTQYDHTTPIGKLTNQVIAFIKRNNPSGAAISIARQTEKFYTKIFGPSIWSMRGVI